MPALLVFGPTDTRGFALARRLAGLHHSPAGERAFSRALELNSGLHRARHWRAMSLACLGRMDEALQLDPLGFQVNQDAGLILLGSGQTEAAIGYLRHALELAPGLRIARVYLTMAWLRLENFEEALDLAGDEPGLHALVRARMGETDAATDLVRAWQYEPPSFTWRAILELALGREESALTSFRRGAGQFESEFLQLFIGVPVLFEGLSGNSEFTGLIRT